jgi:site-specific DNA recombinase
MKGFIRCALYARVSSQKQADELTIDSQLAAIRERVQRDGRQVAGEFEFCDPGYSGSELLRPALERLRDAVSSGLIDQVYIHSPDRLARKLAHQAIVLEEFSKQDCQVVFLSQEGLPDTPEANLLLQLQGAIAEFERLIILERTRRGRRFAAQQGKVGIITRAPYGYRRVRPPGRGQDAYWEIVPANAAKVKMMFELVAIKGYSLGRLQRELFEQGIPTPTGKERWDGSTLRGILVNRAYLGTAKFGKTRAIPRKPGRRSKRGDPAIPRRTKIWVRTSPEEQQTIIVPEIIDSQLFEAVERRMEENRKHQRERQNGVTPLLSGLLVCGCCGYAYCARRVRNPRYRYYRCLGTDKHRRLPQPMCDNPSLNAAKFEALVWEELCLLLRNPERIREELERRRAAQPLGSPKLKELEERAQTLRRRMDRLIDAHTSELIDREEFESRITSLRAQYGREMQALNSLRGQSQEQSDEANVVDSLKRLSAQIANGLATADFNLKRELMKLLISRVEIHKEEIRIVYKVPHRPFLLSPDKRGTFLQHWLERPSTALRFQIGSSQSARQFPKRPSRGGQAHVFEDEK